MKPRGHSNEVSEEELAAARGRNRRRLKHVLDHQPEIIKSNDHRIRGKVSFAEVYEAYKVHDGKCAICGSTRESKRNLALDHDHKTLKVRGILCMRCNAALGMFDDDPDKLKKAIAYLEKHSSMTQDQPKDRFEDKENLSGSPTRRDRDR